MPAQSASLGRRMRRLDDIATLELAYDLTLSPGAWLDGVHQRFASRLDRGFGVSVGSWTVGGPHYELVEQSPLHGDAHPLAVKAMAEMVGRLSHEQRARHYGPHAVDFIGASREIGLSALLATVCAEVGLEVSDGVGLLLLCQPARSGLMVSALSTKQVEFPLAERRRLRRISTHLASAFRLRESLRRGAGGPVAVLSPDGRLLDAHDSVKAPSARRALEDAVKQMEKSRGRLRRTSPEEALLMWKGLVAGTWTVVDQVDTDSRRFLVAHENRFSARALRALSPREVDVAEYLVQGRSTSEMAYALGLRVGTVSRMAREVLRKLGVKGRADLAGLFGGVTPMKADVPGHDGVFALTPGTHPTLWSRLSPSEHDIVRRSLKGARLADIAAQRNTSVKTVKNQLSAVYARFGVRGRAELATLLGGPPG